MQKRHQNHHQYFTEQSITTEKFVIPFINPFSEEAESSTPKTILEIGCGLGGGLLPFLDRGCRVTGIDISEASIQFAQTQFAEHKYKANLSLICSDIYSITDLDAQFDVVIVRDVLEHVPQQAFFLSFIKRFLRSDGVIFIAFPPWQNPFGGHQQILKNKFLSHLPWFHLLPAKLYHGIMKLFKENGRAELMEIKTLGMTIERFLSIVRKEQYQIVKKSLFFINPNYETKFGLRPRKLWRFFNIPYLRNFYTTSVYFLLK